MDADQAPDIAGRVAPTTNGGAEPADVVTSPPLANGGTTEPAGTTIPPAANGAVPADADGAPGARGAEMAALPPTAPGPVAAPTAEPATEVEVVPWRIIWAAIGVVLGSAAAIELLLALQRIVELLVISAFLAVVLSPAVSGLVRLRIRRGLATTFVFFVGMLAFGGLGYLFIHPLYREAIQFANDLPGLLARVQAGKGQIGGIVARYHLEKDAATYIPKIRSYLSNLGGPALGVARTVLSGLGGLILLFIMTFLILLEGPAVVRGTLRMLPPPRARRVRAVLDDIAKSVTGYVIGNFATSLIAGVVCAITLSVLGVPFAIVFGVWVALVDLLPLVGGLLAGVPTVAFAFLHSPAAGIITAIVFLVYQQVENHLLNPIIMSRTVRLNPLWVLLSVLAGAELGGILGALLAIPAAGAIHVIARDVWDERRGRPKPTPTVGEDHTPSP